MSTPSPNVLMIRDELVGFARSKVMLVLWLLMPTIAILAYLAIDGIDMKTEPGRPPMPASVFIGVLLSSIAGNIASLMIAVDLVSERQRKVYELFVIRPVARDVIPISKFVAAVSSVTIACLVAMGLGVATDAIRGMPIEPAERIIKGAVNLAAVIFISGGVGVIIGVISRTILIAVIIIQFGAQALTVVPMLPIYMGVAPGYFWLFMAASFALAFVLVAIAVASFRRAEF
jgi:ABC-2 type transport system permease protein